MTENPTQFSSSSDDRDCMALTRESNPLAVTSLILSIFALAAGLTGTILNQSLESRKVPSRHYEGGDATIISDKAGNAFTFLEQVVVFVVSKVVSVTLALTAAIIGVVAIRAPRNTPAVIGIILSAVSLLCVFR